MMTTQTKIQYSVVTPTGRGAIATVVIIGLGSVDLVNKVFLPKNRQSIHADNFRRAIYGNWLVDGRAGEDLIVCPIDVDRVEVHCHGGKIAVDVIDETLRKQGASKIEPSQFGSAVFLSSFIADFYWTVVNAETWKTAKWILEQRNIQYEWFNRLANIIGNRQFDEAAIELKRSLDWWHFGRRLTDPWKVVICGRPNVGKSSLINALVGFQRAIVHSEAGTTRDVVEQTTALDGWPVKIIDTAGIRKSATGIESTGIELTQKSMENADCKILVLDANQATQSEYRKQVALWNPDIVAFNKCDLRGTNVVEFPLLVSARTGEGITELSQSIVSNLLPRLPEKGCAIPVSDHQFQIFTDLLLLAESRKVDEFKIQIDDLIGCGWNRNSNR